MFDIGDRRTSIDSRLRMSLSRFAPEPAVTRTPVDRRQRIDDPALRPIIEQPVRPVRTELSDIAAPSISMDYLPAISVPGIGRILAGQQEPEKEPVKVGSKPEAKPSVAVPSTPEGQAKGAWILENGKITEVVPGTKKTERLECDGELLIVARYQLTCDVEIKRFTARSEFAAGAYSCTGDAQKESDSAFPSEIALEGGDIQGLKKKDEDGQATSQESAVVQAWSEACECAANAVEGAYGATNDKDGNKIPKPPPAVNDDIVCDPPCIKVWQHWCEDGEFEEVARWCEVTESRGPDGNGIYQHDVVIKVRVKGWIELRWRVTCVHVKDTIEGQKLIAEGALTPDGQPQGHYRPPWAPPPPETPPASDECCCVIESVEITNIRPCKLPGDY